MTNTFNVELNIHTKFLLSTSGSQSSIIKHNEALKKIGINLVYFTFPENITPDVYAGLLRSPFVKGGAVTGKGQLKSRIIPFLDEVEPLAKETLAVNTVVNNNGKLHGYNTDAFGFRTALQKGIEDYKINIHTAVIYGNGGVSGVAFKVLQDLGIKVTMVGRNPDAVLKKRLELGIDKIPHFKGPYDLIVDATPISSDPDFSNALGFLEIIQDCKVVFCHNMPEKDGKLNYLSEYCNRKNIPFIPGNWMYVSQLVKQYNLYFKGYTKMDTKTSITEEDIRKAWKLTN
jgi:shikimate dehydrogenase